MGAIAEDVRKAGTLAAVNDAVVISQPGTSVVAFNLVVSGSNTTVFEATVDEGTSPTWVGVMALNVNTGALVSSATASGLFKADFAGYRQFRVRCSVFASGSVVAVLNASAAHPTTALIAAGMSGGGAVTSVDGGLTTLGTTTNAGIITDIAGTAIGFLRGQIIQWAAFLARFPAALISGRLDVNLGAAPATVNVQGAQTAGAGVATNPLLLGISDGTNAQFVKQQAANTTAVVPTGIPMVVGQLFNSGNVFGPQKNGSTETDASSGSQMASVSGAQWNGTSYDRPRNNTTAVVQASTLTTAQTINTDIVNYSGRAFMAHANVSNYNGGSILMKLQIKDANGLFTDIPGATTGTVTSGADLLLNVGPTVWPANTATMFNLNFFLPRNIRLVTTIATASVTFSQAYDLPAN